ncbi:TPA: HilA/EilA family virulence transcriptional regulator [Escherichia fergusonii]|uniref:HilA/EilA family virulence transcriptional regulator n=1 Tax=Escherichia fergusonii TaxID=564 RepID=UPI0015F46F5F|nr:HilA/EilA family virulence transcriptional regulator [Escherichia fergusonii]EHG5998751.1 HilA/EilA family virulence transcriptional regulator [Escherichia fergusonii]MBA8500747.1 HilA/EilA family virulence transcriptional regulator [Escherichia fergusonii]HAI1306455.1 HilA/EilA family virulence transcriptional regulator [Escherichia fergusonii]
MSIYSGEKNVSRQYLFGDFILRNDGVLLHHNKELHVPPKELEVLILLLDANGEVVLKEQIFESVWNKMAASDESLTRCVYALRRILRENKNCRYIETVYGKGYRFKVEVAAVSPPEKQNNVSTSIAIFPFKTADIIDENLLHNGLIQGMSKYSCYSMNILPAAVTKDCTDFMSIDALLNQLNPDYYFTGQAINYNNGWRFFIELVQARDHKLIKHQSIDFEPEMPLSVLMNRMINLLIEKIPSIQIKYSRLYQMSSLDTAVACLNGRREMYRFTPTNLERALEIFSECISNQPQHPLPYCCLAECYISLAQQGLYDQQQAIDTAMKAVDKAICFDPGNAQTLGLLALLSGLKGENSVAGVLFKQAHQLMPDSADIYYYHSLFHFLKGNLCKALKYVEHCLQIDQNKMGASVLMLWITYYSSTLDDAINLSTMLMNKYASNHPLLLSMMALFLALKGNKDSAERILSKIPEKNLRGYLAVNVLYTRYLLYGQSMRGVVIDFLEDVDYRKIKGSLLPLILIAFGREEFECYWKNLDENNVWSNIWKQDPRLAEFRGLLCDKKVKEIAA